jgi:prolipoprotein diacylglyceryltransferase
MLNRLLSALARRPVLAQRGNFILVTFGPISGTVAFFGFSAALMSQQAFGLPFEFVSCWALCAPLSLLAGSFILPKALNLLKSPQCFIDNIGKISFTFLGGFSGVVIVSIFLAHIFNVSFLTFSDATCLVIPLFHGLSRLACLNYGCCHGKPINTGHLPGIVYRNHVSKAVRVSGLSGVRLHPVQMYELLVNIGIQAALIVVFFKAPRGMIAGAYLTLYGISRALLGKFRFKLPARLDPLPYYEKLVIAFFLTAGFGYTIVAAAYALPSEFLFDRVQLRQILSLTPITGAMSIVIIAAYGLHYKKVGQWF